METLNGTWVRFGVFPALTPKIEFKLFKLFHQTTMALKFHAGLADPLTFQSDRTVGEFGGLSYSLVIFQPSHFFNLKKSGWFELICMGGFPEPDTDNEALHSPHAPGTLAAGAPRGVTLRSRHASVSVLETMSTSSESTASTGIEEDDDFPPGSFPPPQQAALLTVSLRSIGSMRRIVQHGHHKQS